jgi:hypothetical protein
MVKQTEITRTEKFISLEVKGNENMIMGDKIKVLPDFAFNKCRVAVMVGDFKVYTSEPILTSRIRIFNNKYDGILSVKDYFDNFGECVLSL